MSSPVLTPPRLAWPDKKWPSGGWTAGAAATILAGLTFLWTGYVETNWSIRIGILLLCVAVPVAIWRTHQWCTTIIRRALQYDGLYNALERTQGELRQEQSKYEAALAHASEVFEQQQGIVQGLLRLLAEAESKTFKVLDVTWQKDEALLVIADSESRTLQESATLTVASTIDYRVLGLFMLVEQTRGGWLARLVGNPDPTWWGFLSEESKKNSHPQIDAIAVLLPHIRRLV